MRNLSKVPTLGSFVLATPSMVTFFQSVRHGESLASDILSRNLKYYDSRKRLYVFSLYLEPIKIKSWGHFFLSTTALELRG